MRRLLLVFCLCLLTLFADGCIEKFKACGCGNKEIKGIEGKKLFCHNINITNLFAEAQFPKGPILAMDLTYNNAVLIKKETFGRKSVLLQVLRLDLSNNQINRILPRAFSVLPNLTHLNLSRNSIGRLSQDTFLSLPNLRMLDLSANFFPIIPGSAVESLPSLKKLFVESTDLVCNSLMLPFITWYNSTAQKIKLFGTCHLPEDLKSTRLMYLKPSTIISLQNNTLSSLPHFEMSPSEPQLVFEGDEIEIICEGTDLSSSKVIWSFNNVEVTDGHSSSFVINSTRHFYRTVVAGQLRIRNLKLSNSGTWKCTISSEHGSDTRSLQVLVVKNSSVYCSDDSVANDRGSFKWQETISGATTSLICPIDGSDKHTSPQSFATRECSSVGNWTVGEYSQCQYKDYVTRLTNNLLHENLHAQNILQRVRKLVDSFKNQAITNPYAVELIAELLQKIMMFIADTNDNGRDDDLGTQILNLASFVMNTNISILQEAQRTSGSCDRILSIVRNYALKSVVSSAFNKYSPNIAVSGNLLSSKLQYNDGILCRVQSKNGLLKFLCDKQDAAYEPFIYLPHTLFDSVQDQTTGDGYKLYFIAYRNGNLFHSQMPSHSPGSDNSTAAHRPGQFSSSMILEAGVDGHPVVNLSSNAIFNFKNPDPKHHYAAWWSPTEGWLHDSHCYIANTMPSDSSNYTKISCDKITNVTLFYDPDHIIDTPDLGLSFHDFAHPAVFVGTGIMLLCLIPVIFSYICCHSKLKITSDARHMLINICVHLLLVSCAFTLGIWRVDYTAMCLTSGIVMHYSSLSVLLWITISARNIHREMIVYSRPPSVDPKPPQPMLRFYLVGCGIPAVICGITAAAKMQNYDGDNGKYCWLSWETSLFAFYLPAALIATVCVFLLIRVLFAVNRQSNTHRNIVQQSHSGWRNRSERYEGIYHENDPFLKIRSEETPLQYMNQPNGNRLPPEEIPSTHGHPENEQSHRIRLRGVSLLLFFFLATWVAAAISVAFRGMQENIDYLKGQSVSNLLNYQNLDRLNPDMLQENESHLSEVFSCLYAIFSAATGLFLVVQHLICRRDVRSCWANVCSACNIARKGYERNADSQASTVPVGTDDNFSVNDDRGTGTVPPTSPMYNDKTTSLKPKTNRQRENTVTTLSTDPVSTENPLHSTVLSAQGASMKHNGSYVMPVGESIHSTRNIERASIGASGSLGFTPLSSSSMFPPKSSVYISNNILHGYPSHHHHHHAVNSLSYTQQSHPSAHSAYLMRNPSTEGRHTHSPHLSGASPHHMGSSSRHIHPVYLCDSCPADSHRYPPPEIKSYPHYGYYHHHLPHSSHAHPHGSGKPVKMTNLHMAHDSSMTEHSFDELAHNNMHTIPVVMQQQQLYYRYQKMMHKQGKRRKLAVLREYAQDPLTSNDESDRRESTSREKKSADESSPLIQSPEKSTLGHNSGYANYTAIDPVKDNLNAKNGGGIGEQPNGKLRMLLISSPSNRKRKVETSKKISGETPDIQQQAGADAKSHVRGGRSSMGERNSASGGRRAKQSKFHHDNPILSERERGTTSSEKSEVRRDDGDGLLERIKKYELAEQMSRQPSVCSGNFPSDGQLQTARTTNSSLALDYAGVNTSSKDNHGYLTLQQLVLVNPFLPQKLSAESKEEITLLTDDLSTSTQNKDLPELLPKNDTQQNDEEPDQPASSGSLAWRNETSV